jgi:Tfp pilus assembly protein PilV
MCLSVSKNLGGRAYARGDATAERKQMAQWWANYLDQLRAGKSDETNVVSLIR